MNPPPLLRLVRLSAWPSALADVFGGTALVIWIAPWVGILDLSFGRLPWLLLTSTGIYLGGMALNDVMHVEKDALLGKRRPIGAGQVARADAILLTCLLYAAGLVGALLAGCFWAALLLALLTGVYNLLSAGRIQDGKLVQSLPRQAAGVLVISTCRALHVALPLIAWTGGLAALRLPLVGLFVASVFAWFALVTLVSLFEDRGDGRAALTVVYFGTLLTAFTLPIYRLAEYSVAGRGVTTVVAPLVICAVLVMSLHDRIWDARLNPNPARLGAVVGAGIHGESLLMAAFALTLASSQPWWGIAALACYPAGRILSRWISPT